MLSMSLRSIKQCWGQSDGSVVKSLALPEDPGTMPSIHMAVHDHL